MARKWNRLKARVYSRYHWINEWYGRLKGEQPTAVPLPPLAPLRVTLAHASVALVTSAGVHLRSQAPFAMDDPDGDASFRVIPGDVDPTALMITHDYYDHAAADRDPNCVFPLARVREFAAEGALGRAAPRHIGFVGHLLGAQRRRLVDESAPAMARLLRDDGVHLVLATPG